MLVLLVGLVVKAHAASLIDTDFSQAQGDRLPEGWRDASTGQAKASVKAIRDADGKGFVRVDSVADRATVACAIPSDAAADKEVQFDRLTIECRDPSRNAVGVSIRGLNSKKVYWHAVVLPDETWQTESFLFEVEAHEEALEVTILVSRTGPIDLGHVKLERESRDDVIAQFKAKYPDGGDAKNLLRISRYPLGAQSGWGLDREHSDLQMGMFPDESVKGPSGAPALKIISWDGRAVNTEMEPFEVPWPFMRHTVSLYARGKGHLGLVVLADGRAIASGEMDVDDSWKRFVLTFTPPMLAEVDQVQIVTSGVVWIDAMQVEPGEKATPYHSGKACEVSLGLPRSEVSAGRIQFEDEKAVVDWAVSGEMVSGAVLKAKVVDLYGEEKELGDVKLSEEAMQRGEFRIDVFPERPYGQFRVEAHVEDGAGKIISTMNELIVTRIRRPRHWGEDAPESAFGTHMNAIERQLNFAKAIGINWTRLHDAGGEYCDWAFVEPSKGQWVFRDDAIQRYRDRKIEILGMAGTSPAWANGAPQWVGWPEYWHTWLEPVNFGDYSNYVKTISSRYRDEIFAWDIWNEPWGKFWSKWYPEKNDEGRSPTAAGDYAKLEAAAEEGREEAKLKFTLCGIDTMGGNVGPKWTGGVAEAGGLGSCDVYDYHFYNTEMCGWPGDAVERTFHEAWDSAVEKLKAVKASGSSRVRSDPASEGQLASELDKPVWMTEGNGANRFIGRGFYHWSLPDSVPAEDYLQTADYQSRYVARLLAIGVKKIFFYHLNVGGEFFPGGADFQALVTDDGFAHPQAAALSAEAWELEDTRFVKHVDLHGGVHAWIFAGKNRSVAVITAEEKHSDFVLSHPKELVVRDLFGNEVKLGEKVGGRVVFVEGAGGAEELGEELVK